MKGSRVAKRYAIALFEGAKEKGLLETVEGQMRSLAQAYEEVAEFRQLIESPVIAIPEKTKAIKTLFEDRLHPFVVNFLELLIQKNREVLLPSVIEYFYELLDEYRGIVRGTVYAAVEMTEQQLQALNERLNEITGKTVVLIQKVDASLLGGFVVQIKDRVIDNSIRHQLEKLKEQLVEASL